MPDRSGDALCRVLHQRTPLRLHSIGRRGERQRGDEAAAVVAYPGGDAAQPELGLLVVGRPALTLDALELALEQGEAGDRVLRVRAQAAALRVVAQPRRAVLQQEELSGG